MAIEPDRLDNPDGNTIRVGFRKGIEVDEFGRAKRYWIRENHPNDAYGSNFLASRKFTGIPARDDAGRPNVIFGYNPTRPGQSRGYPEIGPVLTTGKDRDDLAEATILRAMAEARRLGFVETEHVDEFDDWFTEENDKSTPIEDIDPLQVFYGEPGEQLKMHDPTTPGETYEPFVVLQKKDIASAIGLPYPHLSADYRGTSWSSIREENQAAWMGHHVEEDLIIDKQCETTWLRIMEEGFLRGEWGEDLSATEFYQYLREYTRANWIGNPERYVDPDKESKATERLLKNMLTTWQIELQKRGLDPEEVLEQMQEWKSELEERGLEFPSPDPSQDGGQNDGEDGEADDGEDNGDQSETGSSNRNGLAGMNG
ncbi:MAG: phage portal protein, partial [Candidatus Omnitrophica bacterium]|nr:phage portal protein [Candidatus Omnitrophota bacterium]